MPLREKDEELLAPVKTKNESPQITELFTSLAAFGVCLILGCLLVFYAYGQLWINWPASSQAETVSLLDLEKGQEPPGHHIKLDEHISMGSDRVADTYPIFSTEGTTIEEYVNSTPGAEFDVSLEQMKYRMRKVRILVRNRKGKRKSGVHFESGVEGMIVGRATELNVSDRLYEKLNIKHPENVYILEVGRKPNAIPGILMAVGAILFFAATGYFVIPLSKSLSKFGYD